MKLSAADACLPHLQMGNWMLLGVNSIKKELYFAANV